MIVLGVGRNSRESSIMFWRVLFLQKQVGLCMRRIFLRRIFFHPAVPGGCRGSFHPAFRLRRSGRDNARIPKLWHIRPKNESPAPLLPTAPCCSLLVGTFFQSVYSASGTPCVWIHARNTPRRSPDPFPHSPCELRFRLLASSTMFIKQPLGPRPSSSRENFHPFGPAHPHALSALVAGRPHSWLPCLAPQPCPQHPASQRLRVHLHIILTGQMLSR